MRSRIGASLFVIAMLSVIFFTPQQSKGLELGSLLVNATRTLTENTIVNGLTTVETGTLDLAGHTLTVNGDFVLSGGTVLLNGGHLIVTGDYVVETASGTPSTGTLRMESADDLLEVHGDFVMNSAVNHSGYLSAGVLDVKGNFAQKYGNGASSMNFYASGTHKTVFSGEGTQTVSFGSPGSSRFQNVEISNELVGGIAFLPEIVVVGALTHTASGAFELPSLRVDRVSLTLQEDMTVRLAPGEAAELGGNTLDLNGHTLTVVGDFRHSSGTLNVNGGALVVEGDYLNEAANGSPSSGTLRMDQPTDIVDVGGDFVMNSSVNHAGYLTNGVLSVMGDFLQKYGTGASSMNFYASGSHKTVFSGEIGQAVSFATPGSSRFQNVDIANEVVGGVSFEPSVAVAGSLTHSASGAFEMPSFHIEQVSLTLTKDLTVRLAPGEVAKLSNGTLNLNGYTLTVVGDFLHNGGTMHINGGSLIVEGDYKIEKVDGSASAGTLRMEQAADAVTVGGDFVMNSSVNHAGYLTAGVLDVAGHFTQKYGAGASSMNFYASGSHKTVFSGGDSQTVSFASPGSSRFHHVEITNEVVGAVAFEPIAVAGTLTHTASSAFELPSFQIGQVSLTLSKDLTIRLAPGQSANLSNSMLDLNGHTLTVVGDFVHSGGTLYMNGGALVVEGDYRVENDDGSVSGGTLRMEQAADAVTVGGDFVMNSSINHAGYLTAGVLDVAGHFTQKSGAGASTMNFYASGTHKTVFSGGDSQIVSFAEPGSSRFQDVEITNEIAGAVAFEPSLAVTGTLSHAASGAFEMPSFRVEHVSFTLHDDLTVRLSPGEFASLGNNALNLNGYTLTVLGDFRHAGGTLNVNGGMFAVEGDYRIEKEDGAVSSGTLRMELPSDAVNVGGDFVMNSSVNHAGLLKEGVLALKGDFTQTYGVGASPMNFYASGAHRTVFSGETTQTIHFDSPSSSRFHILENANQGDGLVLTSVVNYDELWDDAPWVLSTLPEPGAAIDSVSDPIVIAYSEPIAEGTAFGDISLVGSDGGPVSVQPVVEGNVLTILPDEPLAYDDAYSVVVPADAVVDAFGQPQLEEYSFGFYTFAAVPSQLSIHPNSLTMVIGQSRAFEVDWVMPDHSVVTVTADVYFTVDDPNIASWEAHGILFGESSGTTVVTATYGGAYATATVLVVPPSNGGGGGETPYVTHLETDPLYFTLAVGDADELVVTAVHSDDSTTEVTAEASYAVSDPSVASVVDGVVTALQPGVADITITYEDVETTVPIFVMTAEEKLRHDIDLDDDHVLHIAEIVTYLRQGREVTGDDLFARDDVEVLLELIQPRLLDGRRLH